MNRLGLGWLLLIALGLSAAAVAQTPQIHTYTQIETGNQRIPLGYPVPRPVASLTPVDGFRDYASLDARLRLLEADAFDLAGHDVGQTRNGRQVRAYVVSDADAVDVEGRAEAAFFLNAGIHAREWAAPEVSTFLIERMIAGAGDQAMVRYLLDNTRLVIIPVHNVDGLQQSQRFPDRVVIGQDPRVPNSWPRDGRMRRKNMGGVDEVLDTFTDHLGGVDLNRNHPPFWGTTTDGGRLLNPNELIYRGTAPHSEPESLALVQAAELGPPSRIRLGVDLHSYGRVFFSSNTGRSRLNAIQSRLLSLLSSHHAQVPTAGGTPNGALYLDQPDPPNSGIGAAAEYFAYQWLVPAWTLELEPRLSGAEYGGTGASHSGFVLPDAQVRRVREAWAESFLVAFYFMAGPPHLRALRIRDADNRELLQARRWVRDPTSGRRSLVVEQPVALLAGRALRVELVFSKPMRHRHAQGELSSLPGLDTVTQPQITVIDAAGATSLLDTSAGRWLGETGFERYRDDTFTFDWVPETPGEKRLQVAVTDMAGLSLDADPSTPADWQDGAWSGWEDAGGSEGDVGGADRITASLGVALAGNPAAVTVIEAPAFAGEGDCLRILLSRSAADVSGTLRLQGRLAGAADAVAVSWTEGESGDRELALPLAENVQLDGSRETRWEIHPAGDSDDPPLFAGSVQVLDNDRAGHAVVRGGDDPGAALQQLGASSAAQRDLVLEGGRSYRGPDNRLAVCQPFTLQAPLRVFGNRATLQPGESSCSLITLQGEGRVDLRDLELDGAAQASRRPLIQASGQALSLQRVVMRHAQGFLVEGAGEVEIAQSALLDSSVVAAGREGNVAAITAETISLRASSAFNVGSGLEAGEPTLPALFQTGSAQESSLDAFSLDGFPAWLLRGRASLQSSVYFNRNRIGITPPPACEGVRSLGFNVFPQLTVRCFEPLDSDRSLPLDPPLRSGPDLAWRLPSDELVDRGGTCGPVDQRGAPRPQTMDPEAEPRCDVGAVEEGVNPWRGFWQPERDGHGIDLQTAGNVLTLLWYSYADDGQPVAYLAAAPLTGPRWRAELFTARRDPDSAAISDLRVGTVSLDFASDTEARLGWQFDGREAGSERLTAFDFGGSAPRVEVTGSWFPPAESGHGASIARRGEVTALALYYYDAVGVLRWALGQGSGDDVIRVTLQGFTGFCPDCDAASSPPRSEPVGEALLHFRTPQHLAVDIDVRDPGSHGGRWIRAGADWVPLNDAVDNRAAAAGTRFEAAKRTSPP